MIEFLVQSIYFIYAKLVVHATWILIYSKSYILSIKLICKEYMTSYYNSNPKFQNKIENKIRIRKKNKSSLSSSILTIRLAIIE